MLESRSKQVLDLGSRARPAADRTRQDPAGSRRPARL